MAIGAMKKEIMHGKGWWPLWLGLGGLLVAMIYEIAPKLLAPQPYWDVTVVESHLDGGWFYLTAGFIKNGACTKIRFDPDGVTELAGGPPLVQPLRFVDQDGLPDDDSRLAGLQTIRVRLFVGSEPPDRLLIRTRHDCGGITVDKVFLEILMER